MAYTTKRAFAPVATQTTDTLANGTAVGESGATASAVDVGTTPLARGLLWGVRATLSSANGTVTLRAYADSAATDELYAITLNFTGVTGDSDQLASAIPFFDGLYWLATGDATSATKTMTITFHVEAMA